MLTITYSWISEEPEFFMFYLTLDLCLFKSKKSVRDLITGKILSEIFIGSDVSPRSLFWDLFILYLNDFRHILRNCKYNYYADDLFIYFHAKSKNLPKVIREVNDNIVRVIDWTTENNCQSEEDLNHDYGYSKIHYQHYV